MFNQPMAVALTTHTASETRSTILMLIRQTRETLVSSSYSPWHLSSYWGYAEMQQAKTDKKGLKRPNTFWHDLGRSLCLFIFRNTSSRSRCDLYFQYLRFKHGCPATLANHLRNLLYKFNYTVLVSKQNTPMATNILSMCHGGDSYWYVSWSRCLFSFYRNTKKTFSLNRF